MPNMEVSMKVSLELLLEVCNATGKANVAIAKLQGTYIEPVINSSGIFTVEKYEPFRDEVWFKGPDVRFYAKPFDELTQEEKDSTYRRLPNDTYCHQGIIPGEWTSYDNLRTWNERTSKI